MSLTLPDKAAAPDVPKVRLALHLCQRMWYHERDQQNQSRKKGGAMNNKWLSVEKQIEIIALSGVRTNGEISAISAAKFADGREGVVVHYDNGAVRKIAVGQDRVEVTYLATRR